MAIVIRAKDLASRTIASVNRQLGAIGSHASRGLANAARNIERGFAVAGAAAVAGFGYALKAAGDFEAKMNTLNTIAMTTGDAFTGELGAIGDNMRKLARDTGTPLEELTTAYYDLLSAGIKTADAQNVLTAANRLAIGGLATTAETIDLLTTAINSYGGDASKATQYADAFAVSIERGKVTAAEIAASFAQVGPLAAAMGVNIDEIAALLANMTSRGTPAAEAITQIRAAMIALQRQTPEMKRVLDELNITNVEAEVAARGLTPVYNDLARKAEELGIPFIKLTGRVEGTMFALANTGDEFAAFEGHLEAVRQGTGTAQAQMEERQQGLNFQMARMRAIVNDVAITLGSKLIPKIVPMLQSLAEHIEKNQDKIAQFADDVADGFERAVKWAMSLNWGAITSSLKAAAGFGRGIVEAFLAMPDWVKTAVITGWGLNKLTGGALGGIVGELAKGLIRGVLNMNAGVVNVRGAVVNAPGGGPGGGPQKPGMNPLMSLFAILSGAAIGYQVAGPEYERQTAQGRSFLEGKVQAVITGGNLPDMEQSLANLEASMAALNGKTPDGPGMLEELAFGADIGGLKTTMEAEAAALRAAIAAAADRPRSPEVGTSAGGLTWTKVTEETSKRTRDFLGGKLDQLPDTAMLSSEVGRITAAIAPLPPIVDSLKSEFSAKGAGTIAAVRATQATLQGKNFSPTIRVSTTVVNTTNVSIQEWQRRASSASRAFSPTTHYID